MRSSLGEYATHGSLVITKISSWWMSELSGSPSPNSSPVPLSDIGFYND